MESRNGKKRRLSTETGSQCKRQRVSRNFADNTNDVEPSSFSGQSKSPEAEPKNATTLKWNRLLFEAIMDWLDINSVFAFSKTCESSQSFAKAYFNSKYPSFVINIGDEDESKPLHFDCFGDVVHHLQLSGASLLDFMFAADNVKQNLRELSFNRTNEDHIETEHIDSIENILENVRTVCATDCYFEKDAIEYLLMNCKHIESSGFTARKNTTYRFQFQKVPTLKTIEIVFEAKAKMIEILQLLQKKHLQLDELVLSFSNEPSHLLNEVFNVLNAMHENRVFRELYLKFDKKSSLAGNINRLATVNGLIGIGCAYKIDDNNYSHMLDLFILYKNIKYLEIHWLFTNSTIIAQQ